MRRAAFRLTSSGIFFKKQTRWRREEEVGRGPLSHVVASLPSADVVFNEQALAAAMEIKTLPDRFRWPAEICPAPPY